MRGPAQAGAAILAGAAPTAAAAREDGSALALAAAGFEPFYARTSPGLWAYLRRLTGDAALADDVHQEAYLQVLRRLDPAAGERERRAFLYRIATNLVHDRWRHERRERLALAQLVRQTIGSWSRPADAPARLDLDAVLCRMKPRERALLWLAHVEGCEHREIAEILGLAEASVRVLLFRARRKMAALLDARRPEEVTR